MKIKKSILYVIVTLVIVLPVGAQEYPGFRVKGRHLYDKCGEKVILRGINNPNIWFEKNGVPRYTEIDKTGANVIRIVWQTNGTAQELDEAIANCIAKSMIPMAELHDATGDLSKLPDCVDYWIDPDVVDVIVKHEEYLLINIANEAGDWNVTPAEFKTAYSSAVSAMRDAGIHVPLFIDGSDWGKNINILQSEGPDLIESDPDHNLMFSVHMWWPKMYGFSESDIGDEIAESVEMGLPLIVGEFSQMHGSCDENTITDENSIAYKTIIRECEENEIGYIAWSFFGNCNSLWDMSSDGTYESLYDWGLEVAVSDENSIANTAVRPYYISNAVCNPNTVESTPVSKPGLVNLMKNFPNPFKESTRIDYALTRDALVELSVYNFLGEKVHTLNNKRQIPGTYSVVLDAEELYPGVYFYSIKADNIRQTRRMLLLQ